MTYPDPEWVTTIFVTHLASNSVGLDVGLATAPETPSPSYPYLVVDPLGVRDVDGPLNSINELQVLDYQVMSVGLTMIQAMGGISAANGQLLGASQPDFSAASYTLAGDIQIVPAGGGAESEQQDKPSLYAFTQTYRLMLVPLPGV